MGLTDRQRYDLVNTRRSRAVRRFKKLSELVASENEFLYGIQQRASVVVTIDYSGEHVEATRSRMW